MCSRVTRPLFLRGRVQQALLLSRGTMRWNHRRKVQQCLELVKVLDLLAQQIPGPPHSPRERIAVSHILEARVLVPLWLHCTLIHHSGLLLPRVCATTVLPMRWIATQVPRMPTTTAFRIALIPLRLPPCEPLQHPFLPRLYPARPRMLTQSTVD